MWVSSNTGLNRVNLRQMAIDRYYEFDGLHNNSFEEFSSTSHNGVIYMGGLGGISAIYPENRVARGAMLPLYFTSFQTQYVSHATDSVNLGSKKIIFPSDVSQFTILFSTPDYLNSTHITYQYKLEPTHAGWIDLGEKNQVSFPVIVPGDYRLLVRALSSNGGWSAPKGIVLNFLPKWYQAWWFMPLVFFLLSLIIYGTYRYRIMQIKQQHEIRKNIASDLHDDIGSTLNSVKVFAHLARVEKEQNDYLLQIERSLAEASVGLRDMIWVLDDSQDTIEAIVERIRRFAVPVTRAAGAEFRTIVNFDERSRLVNKAEKRNLLLVAKETINNSIKYSGCTIITVTIRNKNGILRFKIEDNGSGFEQQNIIPGNGLKNIKSRAEKMKFRCSIVSIPGEGTTVMLSREP